MTSSNQLRAALILLILPLLGALSSRTRAATITVTSTANGGAGTLRAALAGAANGDTIDFSLPTPAAITLTNGELFITNNLAIVGPGAPYLSISGGNSNRVFNIATNCTVNLSGLTIRDGLANNGIDGGGIYNAGTLTLSNCLVAFNTAAWPGGNGGGVFNLGIMSARGCTFSSNQAGEGSTGISLSPFSHTLTDGGPGGSGGGIYNGGSLTVVSCTFHNNYGGIGGTGGGTSIGGTAATGGWGGSGGGLYNAGLATCTACTFSGNHGGEGGRGGSAISVFSGGNGGWGGTGGAGGGIGNVGTVTVRNTIIALNLVGAGGQGGFGIGFSGPDGAPGTLPDLFGAFTSQGRNLLGVNDGSTGITNGVNGNIVGSANAPVHPRLGALQDNGGPTWTMPLLTGSPALNAGDDTLTGADQRGYPRLSGAHVDIGAFEGVSELFSRGEALFVGEGRNSSTVAIEVRSGAAVGTFVQPAAGTSYQTLGPRGMLCFNNQLLIVNQNVNTPYNGEILKFDVNTGVFINKFVPGSNANAPYAPRGMILGNNSVLYVADMGGFDGVHPGRIARYNSAGTFLGNVVTTGLAVPFYPMGLVIGPDGLLYVSGVGNLAQGSANGYIFRFQYNAGTQNYHYLNTLVTSTAANYYSPGLHSPEGIVFGPEGNIYVTTFYAYFNDNLGNPVIHRDAILVFNKSGQRIGSPLYLYGENETRVFAQALLFGPRDDLFVPITSGSGVRRYSASSSYQQFAVLPTGGESPIEPWYLTFRATNPRTLAYEPPRLTSAVSDNLFNLSWPATYTGWQLETQTNSLATGLSGSWVPVPGSFATNHVSTLRDADGPGAFFRLSAP